MKEFTDIILFILGYFVMWILTVYIHEAGHYITAKLFKMDIYGFRIQRMFKIIPVPTAVNVNFKEKDFENIKIINIKYLLVTINGILTGAIPVIIYLRYQDSLIFTVPIGMVYLSMCSGDITRLWRFLKGDRPYEEFTISVTIPESQGECESVYPNCETCGYFIENECSGDKSQFALIYKPTDVERLRKVLEKKYGNERREVI